MNARHIKLPDETYEFIKGEAAHLLMKYRLNHLPISGFEIAARMGVTLIPYSAFQKDEIITLMNTIEDGFFLESESQDYIYYNNIDCCYERQNWTILHEIGHIVLDHIRGDPQEEAEANFFAKYIIAPPVLLDKLKAKSPMDICLFFDISREAAIYQFQYYLKWSWIVHNTGHLKEYDQQLLQLFNEIQKKEIA